MEYQFSHDLTSRKYRANFYVEHQVFGHWLETEVGDNSEQLAHVLTSLDQHKHHPHQELKIVGRQYTLILTEHDAVVAVSASLANTEMSESLLEQELDFDSYESAMAGIDDFHDLLLAWANFLTK